MAVAGEQTPSRHLEEWMERFLQLLHTVRAPCGIDPCGYGSTMTHWLDVEILDHPICSIKICGALRAIYSETHGRFLAGAHVPELTLRS